MTRITVTDDHPLLRQGLVSLLDDEPDFDVVNDHDCAERALENVSRDRPDVAVMDVRLPGMGGIEACRQMGARWPSCQVVMLTSFEEQDTLIGALMAGARGFVVKTTDPCVLRQAIRYVLDDGIYVDPQVAAHLVSFALAGQRTTGPFGLTMAEMRVIERLPAGLTNKQIGDELGVSGETVKTHVRNLCRKLEARDRTDAAVRAMDKGLV